MKIIQKTENMMVLKDSKQLKSILGGAILFVIGRVLLASPNISTPPVPIWLSLLILAGGVLVAVLAKDTTITLDKGQSKIVVDKQSLIGKEIKECSFDQAKEIQLRQSIHTSFSSKRGTDTHFNVELFLILKEGKDILITSHSRSGHSLWNLARSQMTTNEERLGREISDFTKIPFQTYKPPSVTEMLSSLQTGVPPGMEKLPLEKVEKPPAPESK